MSTLTRSFVGTLIVSFIDVIREKIHSLEIELSEIANARKNEMAEKEVDLLLIWIKDRMINNHNSNYRISDIKGFVQKPANKFYYVENNQTIQISYQELKESVQYKQKLDLILNQKTQREKEIEASISSLRTKLHGSLKDVISEEKIIDIRLEGTSKKEELTRDEIFVYRLIKLGYIDEKYESYINHNYANKNDIDFINSIYYNDKNIGFDIELSDFTKIINSLTEGDYEKKSILNYSLLDYCIKKENNNVNKIFMTAYNSGTSFVEYYYNLNSDIVSILRELSIKLDLTKLDLVDDVLIENNLYQDNEENFEIIILNNWNDKLTNEDEIERVLNSKNINEKLKEYFILKLEIKVDLLELDKKYYNILLRNNKVNPTSKNIMNYYKIQEISIDDVLISFINGNDLTIDSDLSEDFFDNLINLNEINDDKYQQLFEKYMFDRFTLKYLAEDLQTEKVQILVDLGKVSINEDIIEYLENKNVSYIPLHEKEVADILLENEDLEVKGFQTIFDSNAVPNDDKKKLFISRINVLDLPTVVKYLVMLEFDGKLVKIAEKKTNYRNIRVENTPENRAILQYFNYKNIINDVEFKRILSL